MILITRNKNSIEIKGHALYADFGKDIVCSSVSSIVTTTINGIITIDKDAINHEYKNDTLKIEILKNDDITLKLIDNMMELLIKLSNDYPKNVKIKER